MKLNSKYLLGYETCSSRNNPVLSPEKNFLSLANQWPYKSYLPNSLFMSTRNYLTFNKWQRPPFILPVDTLFAFKTLEPIKIKSRSIRTFPVAFPRHKHNSTSHWLRLLWSLTGNNRKCVLYTRSISKRDCNGCRFCNN